MLLLLGTHIEQQKLKTDNFLLPYALEVWESVQVWCGTLWSQRPTLLLSFCSTICDFHFQDDSHDPRWLLELQLLHCISFCCFLREQQLKEELAPSL